MVTLKDFFFTKRTTRFCVNRHRNKNKLIKKAFIDSVLIQSAELNQKE